MEITVPLLEEDFRIGESLAASGLDQGLGDDTPGPDVHAAIGDRADHHMLEYNTAQSLLGR